MKKLLYMAVAAIAVLSSCDKNDAILDVQDPTFNAPVFTATIEGEGETKTQIATGSTASKKKVEWLSTDKVFIAAANGTTAALMGTYSVAPKSDATTATLNPVEPLTYFKPEVTPDEYVAIYPASFSVLKSKSAEGFDEDNGPDDQYGWYSYKIILPQTQKYNGTDLSQIAPMAAISGNTSLTFQNLTALLAITVKAEDFSSVSSITVSTKEEPGLALAGDFTIDINKGVLSALPNEWGTTYNSVTLDYQNAGANTTIAEGESKTFYISIPAKGYPYLQIQVTDGTKTKYMRTKAASITVERNRIYPLTFAKNYDPNLLPGEFSVSATKKVKFTKGNLWCNTTTSPVTYAFETNQYDYPVATDYTSGGTNDGTWLGTHVGHFYWTTTAAASYVQKYYYDSFTNTTSDKFWLDGSDADHKLTVSGTSDLYVLSQAEWTYLINTRANASSLYKKSVTVADKTGCLIIAPDNYTGSIVTEYDAAAWATAEAAGLVCLPFAGYRDNDHPFVALTVGNYWASTPSANDADKAMRLCFMSDDVYTDLDNPREYGFPLRLVKKIN